MKYTIEDVGFTGEHISRALKEVWKESSSEPRLHTWGEKRLYRAIVERFTKDIETIMGRRIAQEFVEACGAYDG